MKKEETKHIKKVPYEKPKVIVSYEKEELDETLNPKGGNNFFVTGDLRPGGG